MPYLIATVMELLELDMDQEEDGANVDLDARRTKCAIIKTTTRATTFLPIVGLVPVEQLKPGDLVGVNKVCAPPPCPPHGSRELTGRPLLGFLPHP